MSIRTERVAALLKSDIGGILQMEYQHDAMLTVTTVRVSPDLMQAHVYLSIFSNQDNNTEIFEFIREKTPEIRKKLASRIRHQVRRIPEIHFHLDDTADYVEKIDALFRKIHDENKDAGDRDQGSEDSGSEDKGSS